MGCVMSQETNDPAALTSCDVEPIHLLGAIQPIGFLLTMSADGIVLRTSANVKSFLGALGREIIGRSAAAFLSADLLHDIRGRLQIAAGEGVVERLFGRQLAPDGPRFDVAAHFAGREAVLEFEPSKLKTHALLSTLRSMVSRVERHSSSRPLFNEAARQVRSFTGFDRVMIYRFDEDGTGEVVAESADSEMQPYLGLRYPASDIPVQARALYRRNLLRLIVDVDAAPIPVRPALSPEGEPLDLSMSVLRSVSPIHLEYLRNMGVRASMSISILQGGQLWGLIACHHREPKYLNFEMRTTAELFGQMFSHILDTRQHTEEAANEIRMRAIHDRIASAFASAPSLGAVPGFLAGISDYVVADGIGAYQAGEISLTGLTPSREEFLQLVKFLDRTSSGRVFATHHLGDVFPPAVDYPMRAAGLLSIPISRTPRDYLVFFRKEVEKTVTWAGQPTKLATVGPNGVRLTPRKSFEAWRVSVKNQSQRWTHAELRAAEALRLTLVELVLRMTETAQTERTASEQGQEILIAELNHRVRNILGLVRGLVSQSAATAADVKALVDGLHHRIGSLARAHDLLTSSDWKPTSLRALLKVEIETYGEVARRLDLIGPDVLLQPTALTPLTLVVHELMTNARKYGALSVPAGKISVTTSADEIGNVSIAWREIGGPRVSAPSRRGFGSMLLEQAIPFELSGVSSPRYVPEGFCLDITLPAAVARCVENVSPAVTAGSAAIPSDSVALRGLLTCCLLVEDNLFIAMDADEMLRSLGAADVIIAKSVSEGLAALAKREITFALLDINLGSENSLPIARQLREKAIVFAFGSGYGDGLSLGEDFAQAPLVGKPYNRVSVSKTLEQIAATKAPDGAVSLGCSC
jgi:light-regulated signal transduction histidine kinase (bacteriophytochrome)/CheY-like chemotaxis protein